MGYPLRWEQLAAPQFEEQPRVQVEEPQIPSPAALRRFFKLLVTATCAVCVLLIVTVVGTYSLLLNNREAPALRLDSAPSGIAVSANSPKIARRLGFAVVTGKVVNRSSGNLNRVEAVVDLLDAGQNVIATQTAMVERESIAPGQSANFQVDMADAPRARAYRLRFKNLYGTDLD